MTCAFYVLGRRCCEENLADGRIYLQLSVLFTGFWVRARDIFMLRLHGVVFDSVFEQAGFACGRIISACGWIDWEDEATAFSFPDGLLSGLCGWGI